MKYVQSFYQYPVTFSSIAKTFPARDAIGEMRNICEVTEAQLETLQRCEPLYRELIKKKKYRILNKLPESYKSSASQINEARDEAQRLREENERLQAQLAAMQQTAPAQDPAPQDQEIETGVVATDEVGENPDFEKMSYKELQEAAKKIGIKYKNVKKSDLIVMIKEATK